MSAYIITVKPQATDSEMERVRQDIESRGGNITHELTLIRGFACTLPDNHYSTFAAHPHVQSVEADGVVTTQ